MGKKQHAARTKGNAKAANSERSAALLSSGDGKLPPMTAFFPTLASMSNQDTEVEVTVDEDFRLTIKKLWKKDAITRLKALQQIMGLLQTKTEESIMGMLPFWPRNFNRLAVDSDRRVREATFSTHRQICAVTGRNLAPYLKSVLSTWLAGMYDTHAPAASAARDGFETVFPPYKHADVFLFYLKDTFHQFRETLFNLTVATVPDAAELDQNEKEAKLARMLTGTLLAASHIVEVVCLKEDPPDGNKKAKDQLGPLVAEIIDEPKFWKFAKHTEPLVKGAFYRLLGTAIGANMVSDLDKATKVTLGCLAEQDPTVCLIIWETSLQLLKSHPDCWQHINLQKAFMPQLNTALKSRAFGTASTVFPILLPLYVQIPEKEKYRDQILANLRESLTTGVTCVTPLSELNAASAAFMECVRYEIVHHTEKDCDILKIYTDHVVPLLRALLIPPESASDGMARVRESRFFIELQSFVLFLEKKQTEGQEDSPSVSKCSEKYNAIESIWESIYSILVEALNSDSLKPLKKLYNDLNTEHGTARHNDGHSRIARKGVRFASVKVNDSQAETESARENGLSTNTSFPLRNANNPLSRSRYSSVSQRFLGFLLSVVRAQPSLDNVNLLGDLFSRSCSDSQFLETFEKDVLNGTSLSSEIEGLLETDEELAPAAVKIILRAATVRGSVKDKSLTIDILEKRSRGLLLVILSEAYECDAQNVSLLCEYFKKDSFKQALQEAFQGPSKWDILQGCLHLCGRTDIQLFPAGVIKWLIHQLVDMVIAASPKKLDFAESFESFDEILQLCDVLHSLFDFSIDAWALPDMSVLVKTVYEASLQWGELGGMDSSSDSKHASETTTRISIAEDPEGPEQVSNRLREVWAGALSHYDHEPVKEAAVEGSRALAVQSRLDLINDIKQRICHATKDQVKCLIRACLELVGEEENDLTNIKRLVPSPSELEQLCVENRVGDRIASLALKRIEGPLILANGDYLEDTGCSVVRNACHILLEVCHSKKATHLLDINFLLFANFIEPQSRLKSVIATLVDDAPSAARVAMDLARREDPHCHLVLDSLLAAVELQRPNSVWRWNECPPNIKQIFIQYERDETKASELLTETVAQVMASEDLIDPNLLCLAARCLRRASGESRDTDVVKLLNAIQGLKGRQPSLFDASSPSSFHLALYRLFIAVLTHCRPALQQLNWDFVLLTLTSMVETFSWTSPVIVTSDGSSPTSGVASRIWSGCGISLTEAIVLMSKLSGEDDENEEVPHNVRHEWRNFYQGVVAQTLIPLMTMAPRKLSQLPGILLESVAQTYTLVDPQEVKKQWPDGDELGFSGILGQLCGLLITNSLPVQMAAYALASRILGEAVREHDDTLESEEDAEDSDDKTENGIITELFECFKDASMSVSMLTKRYQIDDPLPEELLRPTDRTAVSSYMLTSSLVLQFSIRAGREFRGRYLQFLKEQDHLDRYLRNIFVLMPRQPPVGAFSFGLFDERPTRLVHIICWSFIQACSLMPGVVRSWAMQLTDYKQAQLVEKLTVKYVSPLLIERELANVRSGAVRLENVSLVALPSTREIQATYILEDVTKRIQISIQMDACHPLKKIQVIDNCEQVPVSAVKWRHWLYSLCSFLNENGSIQEGLSRWKQNLDRRLEGGGEECCICFSVLHMTTLRLPNYPCRTCKKVFHKTCMYKWLQHGHATCPACRTLIA